jgi:hypothetical protein
MVQKPINVVDAIAVDQVFPLDPTTLVHSSVPVVVSPTAPQRPAPEPSHDGLTAAQRAEALDLILDPPPEETDADRMFDEHGPHGSGSKPGKKLRELTNFEAAHILDLYYRGHKTQCQVAAILKCHQSTVSRILDKYGDTTLLARKTLAAGAQAMAERLVKDSKPKEIVKTLRGIRGLDGTRVLEPERDYGAGAGGAGAINPIFIGIKVDVD